MKKDYLHKVKRLKQLSKKPGSKVSGLVSLTLLTVAFFGVFAIKPTFETIFSLRKEIEDTETVNLKLTKKIQALIKAEEIYLNLGKDIKLLNQVLPETAEFERLAWQVEWLAKNEGVVLTTGSYNEFPLINIQSKEKETIEMELTINGSYEQIKNFLSKIAQIDRLITVNNLTINSKWLKKGQGKLSASIKLSASYLPL